MAVLHDPDPDATVVRAPAAPPSSDPDATVVRVPRRREPDPDATVLRAQGAADPDATVVRAPHQPPLPAGRLPQLALPEGLQLHEYRIDGQLGQGGFGITYLATDVNLHSAVAIKEYLPAEIAFRAGDRSVSPNASEHRGRYQQGLDAFMVEARVLASFRHPAIVRVARFFEAHRTAYMVLEYEKGQSLKAWWPQHRTMTEARLVERLMPLFEGLSVVHAAGVLHRDIKPDNIQVRSADGSMVLLDFGSAGQAVTVPDAEAVVVTPGYAPPEQYGQGAQGPWTDVYALGATLYWMVCGNKPPDAELRQLNPKPMTPAVDAGRGRFGKAFLEAIDAALAMDPTQRPQNIDAFGRRLFADHLASLGLQDALRLGESQFGDSGAGMGVLRKGLSRGQQAWRNARRWMFPSAWPLATKMTVAFVLTALLPMAATGLYNLRNSLQAVTLAEREGLEQLAQSVAGRIGQLLTDTRHQSAGLATQRELITLLEQPDDSLRNRVAEQMQRLVQANPDLQLMMLMDREGTAVVSSDPEVIGKNFRFRQYFQRALAGVPNVSGMTIGAVSGTPGVFFADPVLNAGQQVVGVSVLRLRGQAIHSVLDDVSPSAGLTPLLIDGDGVLIHHPRENLLYRSLLPLKPETVEAMRADQRFGKERMESLGQSELARAIVGTPTSGHLAYRSIISGVDEVAGYAPVPGQSWVVAVSETRESFEKTLMELGRTMLWSLLLVGLLFTGLALKFARSIVQPVQGLTRAADALKAGDFEAAHVNIRRSDELGVLARTFNVMIDVLRQRERERMRPTEQGVERQGSGPPR